MYSTGLNTYQTCIIKINSETEHSYSLHSQKACENLNNSQKACENLNNVPVHNILKYL